MLYGKNTFLHIFFAIVWLRAAYFLGYPVDVIGLKQKSRLPVGLQA